MSHQFPNQPDIGTRVQITKGGKVIKTPKWLINYRYPDKVKIDKLRRVDYGKEMDNDTYMGK